jgi:hypothetical protein
MQLRDERLAIEADPDLGAVREADDGPSAAVVVEGDPYSDLGGDAVVTADVFSAHDEGFSWYGVGSSSLASASDGKGRLHDVAYEP